MRSADEEEYGTRSSNLVFCLPSNTSCTSRDFRIRSSEGERQLLSTSRLPDRMSLDFGLTICEGKKAELVLHAMGREVQTLISDVMS